MVSVSIKEVTNFILELDALKLVCRRTYICGGKRLENSAEHSWHLALASWLLATNMNRNYSIEKLLKLALIHDLGEIDPGDTFLYDKNRDLAANRERKCVSRLAKDRGNSIDELLNLWEEQEIGKSPEAKFLKVVDRLLPFLHNITSGGQAWKDNDIHKNQVLDAHKFIKSEEPEIYAWFIENLELSVKKKWLKSDVSLKKMNQYIKISSDKTMLDIEYIHNVLKTQYWAQGIPKEIVKKSIQNSFCFGVYKNNRQIGFARVVTDLAIFAYLADVFIDDKERKKGYGKQLIQTIVNHTEFQTIIRWHLLTKDAHNLYKPFGFSNPTEVYRHMEMIKKPNYKNEV